MDPTIAISAANLVGLFIGFGMIKADLVWLKETVQKHDKKIHNGMSEDIARLKIQVENIEASQ